jgi:septum formation protein
MNKKIILASASPRRKDLLKSIGLKFETIPSNIDENIEGQVFSCKLIEKLSYEKANDIAKQINYPAIVIGSDTVVVINGEILGKPADEEDAKRMLLLLSGNTHEVISAITIIDTETLKILSSSVISKVEFRKMQETEIENYIKTGEPFDKAGSYAIQGIASIFVKSIKGCYNNIVGISTFKLSEMLEEFGVSIL